MTVLALSDITLFDNDPRILDLTLAARLGFERPRKVRDLVERNLPELKSHGDLCPTTGQTSAKGGRPSVAYYLNEAQALLICMFSRTPKAAEVRKAVIDVFTAYRRGEITIPSTHKRPVRPTAQQIDEMRSLWTGGAWPLDHLAMRYNMSISGVKGHLDTLQRYSTREEPGRDGIDLLDKVFRAFDLEVEPGRTRYVLAPRHDLPSRPVVVHAVPDSEPEIILNH